MNLNVNFENLEVAELELVNGGFDLKSISSFLLNFPILAPGAIKLDAVTLGFETKGDLGTTGLPFIVPTAAKASVYIPVPATVTTLSNIFAGFKPKA